MLFFTKNEYAIFLFRKIMGGFIMEKEKDYYDYDPRLNYKPGFNLFQQNFEEEPYSTMLQDLIKQNIINVAAYQPRFDCSMVRLNYSSQGQEITYYKISPAGCADETLPVIIYYHGGAFIFPLDLMMLNNACYYAAQLKCHVLLPDYLCAPEYSSDFIVQECYDFLIYAQKNASALHIDMSKLLIFGDSAGGALAAAVTLMARDFDGPKALGQLLIYPVTDEDTSIATYPSMGLKYAEWNKAASEHMFNLLFSKGRGQMTNYIVPISNSHHDSLPPAYIEPSDLDSLRDEALAYGDKLKAAGVPVTINITKATHHGFDNNIENEFVLEILDQRCLVMRDMFSAVPAS